MRRATAVCAHSAAKMTKSIATPSSPATKTRRSRFLEPPPPAERDACIACATLRRVLRTAGKRANTTGDSPARTAVMKMSSVWRRICAKNGLVVTGRERDEVESTRREQSTDDRREACDAQALDRHLTHETPLASADRASHGHLPLPGAEASHHETSDVEGRHDHHEDGQRDQQNREDARLRAQCGIPRAEDGPTPALIGGGIGLGQRRGHDVELSLCLFDGDALGQATDNPKRAVVARGVDANDLPEREPTRRPAQGRRDQCPRRGLPPLRAVGRRGAASCRRRREPGRACLARVDSSRTATFSRSDAVSPRPRASGVCVTCIKFGVAFDGENVTGVADAQKRARFHAIRGQLVKRSESFPPIMGDPHTTPPSSFQVAPYRDPGCTPCDRGPPAASVATR